MLRVDTLSCATAMTNLNPLGDIAVVELPDNSMYPVFALLKETIGYTVTVFVFGPCPDYTVCIGQVHCSFPELSRIANLPSQVA